MSGALPRVPVGGVRALGSVRVVLLAGPGGERTAHGRRAAPDAASTARGRTSRDSRGRSGGRAAGRLGTASGVAGKVSRSLGFKVSRLLHSNRSRTRELKPGTYKHNNQWRIQDFRKRIPTRGDNLVFSIFLAENCMEFNEIGPRGGAHFLSTVSRLGSVNENNIIMSLFL